MTDRERINLLLDELLRRDREREQLMQYVGFLEGQLGFDQTAWWEPDAA